MGFPKISVYVHDNILLRLSLSSEDTHFKKLEIQSGTNQTTRLYREVSLKRPPSSRTKTGLSSEAVLITRAKTYFNWLFGTEKMWSEHLSIYLPVMSNPCWRPRPRSSFSI